MDRTTEMLSSFACALKYDDLAPETVHQVKRVLVDTVACALGGYNSEPAKMVTQLAKTVSSTLPCRILGTEYSSSPDMAGFANSVMVRYLDYNDIGIGSARGARPRRGPCGGQEVHERVAGADLSQ